MLFIFFLTQKRLSLLFPPSLNMYNANRFQCTSTDSVTLRNKILKQSFTKFPSSLKNRWRALFKEIILKKETNSGIILFLFKILPITNYSHKNSRQLDLSRNAQLLLFIIDYRTTLSHPSRLIYQLVRKRKENAIFQSSFFLQ